MNQNPFIDDAILKAREEAMKDIQIQTQPEVAKEVRDDIAPLKSDQ
jgi:hypothetical protein